MHREMGQPNMLEAFLPEKMGKTSGWIGSTRQWTGAGWKSWWPRSTRSPKAGPATRRC